MTYHYKMVRQILNGDYRAKYPDYDNSDYDPFKNPLIHKQINGTIISPLDQGRLWGRWLPPSIHYY